jgi:hypothetical protein
MIPLVPCNKATPPVVESSQAHISARAPDPEGVIVPLISAMYVVADVGVEVPVTLPPEAVIGPTTCVEAVIGTHALAATVIAAGNVSPILKPLVVTLQFHNA